MDGFPGTPNGGHASATPNPLALMRRYADMIVNDQYISEAHRFRGLVAIAQTYRAIGDAYEQLGRTSEAQEAFAAATEYTKRANAPIISEGQSARNRREMELSGGIDGHANAPLAGE